MGALEEGRFDPDVTKRAIENAVSVLLMGLGEDSEREGLRKTPMRVAKAFMEGTTGYKQKVEDIVQGALFPEAGLDNGTGQAGGSGGLVVVRNINLFSYCESCLLPFSIKCHIGYVPSGNKVVGLSKLSRVADVYAKRLQEPERLAKEICEALQNSIKPDGVSVALQCRHIQFPSRSSRHLWLHTSVCSSTGIFHQKKSSFHDDFQTLLKFGGRGDVNCSSVHSWCPSRSLDVPEANGHISPRTPVSHSSMVAAAASIILLLGEDPSRKELVGTPYRYVQWLMNFSRHNIDPNQNRIFLKATNLNQSSNELISELNLPFCAQCEHHLLPFHGVLHIGYFHEREMEAVDRPALQSMVHFYTCQLQVQERLTRQIAQAVYTVIGTGAIVVVEAHHICMISRGVEKVGSSTATIAVMGKFSTDDTAKALFLETVSKVTEAAAGS